ncbi:hypothetical protein NX059_010174 [Plenodomus lindquistii]|nr:hypothetical protein NX059_010174 [Plenodomus lindquistii]
MRQYRYEGTKPECQWNGPVWPFQTTQVLTGLANFLDHYPKGAAAGVISKDDFTRLLRQYAQLHYNPNTNILDLEEDYYPDSGAPIVGLKRSHHYFHSGFIDLIISGLVGLRPSANNVLVVNPLADRFTSYFRSSGLKVEVDGKVVASSPTLSPLSVNLARVAPPAITRRIAKSVQLSVDTAFPKGSVSVANVDAREIYGSIDGRIWFWPEADVANGWSTPAGTGAELWYQIDFGATTTTASAELAFFADQEQGFDVPLKYRIQVLSGSTWKDVSGAKYAASVANGITIASWNNVNSGKIRIVFTPKQGVKVRLAEFKVYS